jgi:hypothetical protein
MNAKSNAVIFIRIIKKQHIYMFKEKGHGLNFSQKWLYFTFR